MRKQQFAQVVLTGLGLLTPLALDRHQDIDRRVAQGVVPFLVFFILRLKTALLGRSISLDEASASLSH
jgi:hypothetical protein